MRGIILALLIAVPILFLAVFGVIAAVIVRGRRGERDRVAGLAEQARARGWRFTPAPTGEQRAFWGLGTGMLANRDSKLVEFDRRGMRVAAWEHVDPGDEDTPAVVSYQVVLALPQRLPDLSLVPEATAALSLWRGKDIQFESQVFNDVWRVSADSDRFAHDVVHPRMMQFLLQPAVFAQSIRIVGARVRTGALGALVLARVDGQADLLADFVALIPRQVWDNSAGQG